ncbi:hypothetical protein [Alkalinema sp. FACHB-956]|uniref:hypothetical protein n=1 Tax=Alkalinema sp. FACHB-956 TaxID=2692768 RepID=UPI001682A230|nr:hypothetical protein [Alkalinema sp. FACHB-956]MBD2328775.1 hypothetical protein [Alkalinema sp. FACHB-956]
MSGRKIVLFELNEVPYKLVDHFCQTHPQSHLAKMLGKSQQYKTYAADSGELSPTKTWPTVHRGVNNDLHGLTNFGQELDEVNQAYPPLWQILASQGVKVGVCGSFFTFPVTDKIQDYAFYLPDVFAAESTAHPQPLEAFQSFNLAMSRASARNVSKKIDVSGALKLLPALPQLGLTSTTIGQIGQQLLAERQDPTVKTRRRTYQTLLSFDIFMKQLQKTKPDFATFFTNHVAANMHRYWAAAFPDDYKVFNLKDEWVNQFRGEIDFAMQKADELLGRLIAFVDRNPEYVLLVVSSMGQAAFKAEHVSSCVGIVNFERFMGQLGIAAGDYEERPAMAPIFNVMVNPDKQDCLRQKIGTLEINGQPFAQELEEGFFEFCFKYFQNYSGPEVIHVEGQARSFVEMGLASVPHEDGVYLTGDHIPEGILFNYDPQKASPSNAQRTKISTLDIAPSILENYSVSIPTYMNSPFQLVA